MRKSLIPIIITMALSLLKAPGLKAEEPRLLVIISVDQLTSAQMERALPLMGQGGLRRLLEEGAWYRQATYPFQVRDRAAAMASVMTGSTPSLNGIMALEYFDRETLRRKDIMDDKDFMGNTTQQSSSPLRLLTPTLTDQVRSASQGVSQIYSVAPWRDAAILGAGHSGSAAFWVEPTTGKWCSTTYYHEFPWYVSDLNQKSGIDSRIRGLKWEPLLDVSAYTPLPVQGAAGFSHVPYQEREGRFTALTLSATVNQEVNLLVGEILAKGSLGRSLGLDVLHVGYYAGAYMGSDPHLQPLETEDACLRLDRAIQELMISLEASVGLDRTLICLVSTSRTAPATSQRNRNQYRFPGGDFFLDRCATLLNMYLMATFGAGQYVTSATDLSITLDRQLIEKNGQNWDEVLKKSAAFLLEFSGVRNVHTVSDLRHGSWSPDLERIRKGTYLPLAGDLILEIQPGWNLMSLEGEVRDVVSLSQEPVPMVFWGAGIRPRKVSSQVSVLQAVPTLARMLNVEVPSGCQDQAIGMD